MLCDRVLRQRLRAGMGGGVPQRYGSVTAVQVVARRPPFQPLVLPFAEAELPERPPGLDEGGVSRDVGG